MVGFGVDYCQQLKWLKRPNLCYVGENEGGGYYRLIIGGLVQWSPGTA
jgi:hypothetical protein